MYLENCPILAILIYIQIFKTFPNDTLYFSVNCYNSLFLFLALLNWFFSQFLLVSLFKSLPIFRESTFCFISYLWREFGMGRSKTDFTHVWNYQKQIKDKIFILFKNLLHFNLVLTFIFCFPANFGLACCYLFKTLRCFFGLHTWDLIFYMQILIVLMFYLRTAFATLYEFVEIVIPF